MLIHVKAKDKPKQELNFEEINEKLNIGELDGNELAWTAGLSEWTLLRNIKGVEIPSPPPLPNEADSIENPDCNQHENISTPHHHLAMESYMTESQISLAEEKSNKEEIEKVKTLYDLMECPICHKKVTPIVDDSGTISHCPKCGYHGDKFIAINNSKESQSSNDNLISTRSNDTLRSGNDGQCVESVDIKTTNKTREEGDNSPKICPKCKLLNPPETIRCDCGYDFIKGQMSRSTIPPKERKHRGGKIKRIILSCIGLSIGNMLLALIYGLTGSPLIKPSYPFKNQSSQHVTETASEASAVIIITSSICLGHPIASSILMGCVDAGGQYLPQIDNKIDLGKDENAAKDEASGIVLFGWIIKSFVYYLCILLVSAIYDRKIKEPIKKPVIMPEDVPLR